jgi:hypothetical protein
MQKFEKKKNELPPIGAVWYVELIFVYPLTNRFLRDILQIRGMADLNCCP